MLTPFSSKPMYKYIFEVKHEEVTIEVYAHNHKEAKSLAVCAYEKESGIIETVYILKEIIHII